jgi:hypothetical protein
MLYASRKCFWFRDPNLQSPKDFFLKHCPKRIILNSIFGLPSKAPETLSGILRGKFRDQSAFSDSTLFSIRFSRVHLTGNWDKNPSIGTKYALQIKHTGG